MVATSPDEIRAKVREGYEGSAPDADPRRVALAIGYSAEELEELSAEANLGFGCGHPVRHASLRPGETVVDLGCGAGIDVILAALVVGSTGRVIGVDMTPAMLARARGNLVRSGVENTALHEAPIESLPFDDASVDVVISNGVINLSPEKQRVLREAHRVLRPRGRLAISDLVVSRPVPAAVARPARIFLGSLGDSAQYVNEIECAGFSDVRCAAEIAYGDKVLRTNEPFRSAAREAGAPPATIEAFTKSVSAVVLCAKKS